VPRLARLTLSELSFGAPKRTSIVLGTIAVEALSRALGWLDFRAGKSHHIWTISPTTKQVVTDDLLEHYEGELDLDLPARQAANI
jgi:hypothetical protein